MLFGEIVEPSSRALISDDFDAYSEPEQLSALQWEGNFELPTKIEKLIFAEGDKIIKIFEMVVLKSASKVCTLNDGVLNIYKLTNGQYVVTYNFKQVTIGEVMIALLPWIQIASDIIAISNNSLSTLQNVNQSDSGVIRMLTTNSQRKFPYKILEAPNLVSNLGGAVFSFCHHRKIACNLFICYMDNSPLDTLNTRPIIELIKQFIVSVDLSNLNYFTNSSNLYL